MFYFGNGDFKDFWAGFQLWRKATLPTVLNIEIPVIFRDAFILVCMCVRPPTLLSVPFSQRMPLCSRRKLSLPDMLQFVDSKEEATSKRSMGMLYGMNLYTWSESLCTICLMSEKEYSVIL